MKRVCIAEMGAAGMLQSRGVAHSKAGRRRHHNKDRAKHNLRFEAQPLLCQLPPTTAYLTKTRHSLDIIQSHYTGFAACMLQY